jgi:hypothetical protein
MFTFCKRLIQMTLVIVVTISVAAFGIMYWIWQHRAELTKYQVSQAIHQFAPEWDFKLSGAYLTSDGRLQLTDFQLKDPMLDATMIYVPDTEIGVNWDLYQRTQQIELAKIVLNRPLLEVRKLPDGTWTITNFPPIKTTGKKAPPIEINDGTVRISADDPLIGRTVQYALRNLKLRVNTTDEKILQIACEADGGQAGKLDFRAAYSLTNETFLVEGNLDQLQFGNSLVDLVLAMLPDLKPKVDQFHARLAPEPKLQHTASLKPWDEASTLPSVAPENLLQTRMLADVNFSIMRKQSGQPVDVSANVDILEGFIDHPRLPMAMQRLNGKITLDQSGLHINDMTGMSGQTQLDLAGEVPVDLSLLSNTQATGVRFVSEVKTATPSTGMIINVSNVQITDRFLETAPKGVQGIINHLNATGTFDAQFRIRTDETGIHNDLVSLTVTDGTARPNSFPYPLTHIRGTIHQHPESEIPLLVYDMQGMAGDRPIQLKGHTRRPGPDHETLLDIHFENLPLNEAFISALPDNVETLIRKFHLTGQLTAQHQIYFPQGTKRGHQQKSKIQFANASMNWDLFPYLIENVNGDLSLDNNVWTFSNVTGRHLNTNLSGVGKIDPANPEYVNAFEIIAQDGQFDTALRHAVGTAHNDCEKLWQMLSPQGTFNAKIVVKQHRDKGVEVALPYITTEEAELTPSFLPYRLERVKSEVTFGKDEHGENSVTIHKMTAQHSTTLVSLKGNVFKNPQFWTARLEDMHVDNIVPNDELIAALPSNIRTVVTNLKVRDPLSMRGRVEFKGTYEEANPAVTAAWDLVLNTAGMTLDLDMPIEKITGKVTLEGIMTPSYTEMLGRMEIDSLFFMGYPITQVSGPFKLVNNQLIFGSSQTFGAQSPGAPKTVSLDDRIQGRIFEGIVSLDSILTLNKNFDYRSRVELTRGSLANWAQLNGYGASQIRGNMNGWIDLTGQGTEMNAVTGRGQLWIDQAELYELPLFIRLFNVLKFVPPDKTAFRYAYADFGIANSRFNFDQIELIGSSIGMSGNGYIQFDQIISMDLISKIPRNQSPVPLVNSIMDIPMLRQATEGIVQVHVGGKVKAPVVESRSGLMNNSFRRFTQNFNFNNDYQAPRYAPPPTFSAPNPR